MESSFYEKDRLIYSLKIYSYCRMIQKPCASHPFRCEQFVEMNITITCKDADLEKTPGDYACGGIYGKFSFIASSPLSVRFRNEHQDNVQGCRFI